MYIFRILVLLVAAMPPANAAPGAARIAGTTATQVILEYAAPDTGPCTVEVSESPALKPLAHDVDPLLFPGSAGDDRPENLNSGPARRFIIGKRTAQVAADGRRYSRALAAYTQYYYRISCGESRQEGTFRTGNIPLGKTYGEILPVDLKRPGDYAWPDILWSDARPSVVDPLTGIVLQPVSRPGVLPTRFDDQKFIAAASPGQGEWSNPSGALAESGAPATYSGTGRDWLFLRAGNLNIYGGANWRDDGGFSLDYVQVRLRAWSPGDDRAIEICLTVNSVACASVVHDVALPAKPPAAPLLVGTTTPGMEFWTDATHPIARPQAVRRNGSVAVDAQGAVTLGGGDLFNPQWTAGSRIRIGNSECAVASLEHGRALHVDPRLCQPALPVPVAGAPYSADNFGVLIRKKTGAGSVSIQSARYQFGVTRTVGWASGPQTLYCADKLSPDGGNAARGGFHCDLSGDIFWIDPVQGESRLLGNRSLFKGSVGGDNVSGCHTDAATFRADDPDVFYCASNGPGDKTVVLQARYTGRNQTPDASRGVVVPAEWTNLTPAAAGTDLGSLVHDFDPAFDPRFTCGMRGKTADDQLAFTCYRQGQDTLSWIVVFDPATRKVVAARKSWEPEPTRWCKVHSQVAIIGSGTWMSVTPAYNGDPDQNAGGGPWKSRIMGGAIPAGPLHACPANAFGVTAAACSDFEVEGEPCDRDPNPGDPLNCPHNPAFSYLMPAQPGDAFALQPGATETVRLLAKNGNRWTFERGYGWTEPQPHPQGSELKALCSASNFDISQENMWLWNYKADPHGLNRDGNTVAVDMTGVVHGSYTRNVVAGSPYWKHCKNCLEIRKADDVPGWISKPFSLSPSQVPLFAGQTGLAYQNFIQSYATFPPTAAKAPEGDWVIHARPLESDRALLKLAPVEGALYKVTTARELHRRILPTFATCGMHPLGDVSGPASVIDGSGPDAFTYCVAERPGECRDRARTRATAAGDVFVNCPAFALPLNGACEGSEDDRGICLGDNGAHVAAMVQVGLGIRSDSGGESRVLGNFLNRYRVGVTYWNARALPDASWVMTRSPWVNLNRTEALMARMPPYPQPDGVNRADFVPLSVTVAALPGAAAAVVDFGYAENGDPGAFFCTSRRETCVKGNQPGNLYAFAFEAPAPVPCPAGCTIKVPVIPQRAVYYRARYFNASGKLLQSGPPSVALVP